MSKTITVTIERDGATKVETEGFTGASCRDATEQLQKALGVTVSDDTTPEWHAKEQQAHGH